MNRDDIIRMAREADAYADSAANYNTESPRWLRLRDERFATLVAAAERKRCIEAWNYLTDSRLERQWCAVCVIDQTNLPKFVSNQQPAQHPLTDEQIRNIAAGTPWNDFNEEFARAIERAHGITGETK